MSKNLAWRIRGAHTCGYTAAWPPELPEKRGRDDIAGMIYYINIDIIASEHESYWTKCRPRPLYLVSFSVPSCSGWPLVGSRGPVTSWGTLLLNHSDLNPLCVRFPAAAKAHTHTNTRTALGCGSLKKRNSFDVVVWEESPPTSPSGPIPVPTLNGVYSAQDVGDYRRNVPLILKHSLGKCLNFGFGDATETEARWQSGRDRNKV